jgi:hypothetical protein
VVATPLITPTALHTLQILANRGTPLVRQRCRKVEPRRGLPESAAYRINERDAHLNALANELIAQYVVSQILAQPDASAPEAESS